MSTHNHRVLPDWRLLVLGALLFAASFVGADSANRSGPRPDIKDPDLYAAVVSRIAGGENYYAALREELPARGYAVRPLFHWRLPTLAWLLAALTPTWAAVCLWTIGGLAIAAWTPVLRPRWHLAPGLLFLAPLWLAFDAPSIYLHELWAGELIALSLALWIRESRWALLAAAAALAIREHAALFVVIIAMTEAMRSWKRAVPWIGVLVAGAIGFAIHASQVLSATPPDGLAKGWGSTLGWAFAVKTSQVNVLLIAAPFWVAALASSAAIVMLWHWRSTAGRVTASIVTIYMVTFAIAGRPDNWYWGLLIGPLLPLGLIARPRAHS